MIVILFLLLLLPVQSFAATYYVAKTGNNSNPGTTGSPKLTISGASGGLSLLASGDTLIIRAGTYTDVIPQATIPAGGGSFATATTLKAETALTVTLTGGGGSLGHYNPNQSYIIWDGFVFDVSTNFIIGQGANHIRLTNFELKNSVDNGFIVESGSNSNEFLNGSVHNCGSNPSGPPHNFYVGSAFNIFENLDVYNAVNGYGIHLYDGGSANVHDNIIRNCKVHNNARSGILISDGVNNKIYNNFVYDNNEYGIMTWHETDNALIANNTVKSNGSVGGGSGIYVAFADTSGVSIINNISRQNASGSIINAGTGTLMSGNFCDTANTGLGCITISGNLNFVSSTDLHLQTSSTAVIDKITTNLPTSVFTTDIDGTTRTSPWDIGADEVAASATPVITLNQPAAGASWTIGTQQTITWTSSGTVGANVIIEMDRDNNTSYETSIVASTPTANGSYTWTSVTGPDTAGNNTAKVRVKDTGAATNSISGLFKIAASAGGGLTKRISDNSGADIPGVDDAYMYSPSPTVNTGAEDGIFVSKNDATTTHNSGLIRFSGLSQIPSTATVTSVTLGLYLQYTGSGATSQTVQLRRVLRSWNELQATWNNFNTTTAWQTAGALGALDRDSTVLASMTVSTQTPAYYTVTDTGALKTFVQNIVSGTAANEGLHLEDSTTGDDVGGFTSSDGTNGQQRPYLDVTYTVGTSTITVTEPKSGDLFLSGQQGPARWTSQGISGNVLIELSRDGGTTWVTATLINGTPASSVPYDSSDIALLYEAPTSSSCKLRVVSLNDTSIVGTSSASFRIGGTRAGFLLLP